MAAVLKYKELKAKCEPQMELPWGSRERWNDLASE